MKLAALGLALLALSGRPSSANTVTFDFDTGAPVPPVGTTTDFSYTQNVVPDADYPFPTLTALFHGVGTSFVVTAPPNPVPGGLINYLTGTNVNDADAGLLVTLPSPLGGVSFNYIATGQPGDVVTIAITELNGNTLVATQSSAVTSGTFSFTAPTPSQFFNKVKIQLSSNVGDTTLSIDSLAVTAIPEIDPSSAVGALTLLGSAVVMFRGRRKAVRV